MGWGVLQPGEILIVSYVPRTRTPLDILDWKRPEPALSGEDKPPLPRGEPLGPSVGSVNTAPSSGPEPPLSALSSIFDAPQQEAFIRSWELFPPHPSRGIRWLVDSSPSMRVGFPSPRPILALVTSYRSGWRTHQAPLQSYPVRVGLTPLFLTRWTACLTRT